ncbi:hypothetical protein TSUD_258410, partial [Trifolium subterraneum]
MRNEPLPPLLPPLIPLQHFQILALNPAPAPTAQQQPLGGGVGAEFDGVEDIDILLEEEQPLPGAGVVHEQHELLEYEPHLDEEFLAFLHADDNGGGVDVGDGVDQPPPVVAFVEAGQLLPEHGVGGGVGQQVMNIDPPPIAFPEEPYFVGQFFDFGVEEPKHGVGQQ